MQINTIILYLLCLFIIFIIGKFLILPIKLIFKLILNSILGIISLYIINTIGSYFGFHIGINLVTTLIVAFLGIPGTILLSIISL